MGNSLSICLISGASCFLTSDSSTRPSRFLGKSCLISCERCRKRSVTDSGTTPSWICLFNRWRKLKRSFRSGSMFCPPKTGSFKSSSNNCETGPIKIVRLSPKRKKLALACLIRPSTALPASVRFSTPTLPTTFSSSCRAAVSARMERPRSDNVSNRC